MNLCASKYAQTKKIDRRFKMQALALYNVQKDVLPKRCIHKKDTS